jgi:UDP-N-acetylglucosamine:LPS N-acetylglucosamine transferase
VPEADIVQQAVSVAAEHVSPYKILGFGGSLLGAVMQDSLLLQLPILLVVANGTAVVAKKLLAKMERVTKRTLT